MASIALRNIGCIDYLAYGSIFMRAMFRPKIKGEVFPPPEKRRWALGGCAVCIWGSWWSQYAYGYRMTLITFCIQGFVRCLYAYRDISVTNHMHNEIVSTWEIKSCIPICKIMHTGIAVHIWGSPYAYGQGTLKYSHAGIPNCITKLCAYWK
jgi:hypothetical protein